MGSAVSGVVTGVRDFGAFVNVGVGKDGLLHVREMDGAYVADARERYAVGEAVRVFVKSIDAAEQKFTLTARDPAAAMAAAAQRERTARAEAEREHAQREAERARQEAARARWEAERARREAHERKLADLREIEANMVAEAEAREASAAEARAAAGLLLTAAELLRGKTLPPAPVEQAAREVLVRKEVDGRQLVLYKMPWKYGGPSAGRECMVR